MFKEHTQKLVKHYIATSDYVAIVGVFSSGLTTKSGVGGKDEHPSFATDM